MKITYEIDFETYETRKSAQALLRRINAEGKANQLDAVLTDLYPDGMTESELDDLLDYEEDDVLRWLDMRSETDVRSDITDKEAEIENAEDEIKELEIDIADYEAQILNTTDDDEIEGLREQITDAECDISSLRDDIEAYTEELDELRDQLDEILSY